MAAENEQVTTQAQMRQVEYRVVGDLGAGSRTLTILTERSLAECRERVEAGIDPDYENVRVQESRCTPWEDVADE